MGVKKTAVRPPNEAQKPGTQPPVCDLFITLLENLENLENLPQIGVRLRPFGIAFSQRSDGPPGSKSADSGSQHPTRAVGSSGFHDFHGFHRPPTLVSVLLFCLTPRVCLLFFAFRWGLREIFQPPLLQNIYI